MLKICLIVVVLIFFSCASIFCQALLQPLLNEKKLKIEAIRTNEKIKIDGELNEDVWMQCKTANNFVVSYPTQGKKPVNQTEVKVLYDNINIYIGAICHYKGKRKKLQVVNMSRDFSYSYNELFNVMLGTYQDVKSPVLSLSVTPFNTQLDIMHFYDGSYNYNWNALWKSACSIGDSIWIAEIAIPFSSIRYPADSTVWAINFTRNDKSTGELSGWSLWPLAYSASRLDYGGLLTNIHPPKSKLNLRLQPYTLFKSSTSSKAQLQPGGDIKWAINTNTLLDATLNTDFAQTEVDMQVVNLTRSSVYFPEKRQFFLENANLFSIGKNGLIQPFFSRKVGLSDAGSILPINAGLRLVSQSPNQSYGFLTMKQGGDSAIGSSWFNVMRYRRNIGKNLQAGIMEVLRYDEKSKNLASSFNPVSSVDLFWRMNSTMYARSMGSFSSYDKTHKEGWAASAEWNYSTNLITADITETIVNKGYNPRAGFLARENFINTQPVFSLNIHKNWFPHSLAFFSPSVSADIFHQANSKKFEEANYFFSPFNFVFLNFWQVNFSINFSKQRLSENFKPVSGINILRGNYEFINYQLKGQTNQAAHYSMSALVTSGEYYDGNLNSYSVNLRAAPIPHIAVNLNYTRNSFNKVGEYKTKLSTYLISPQMLLALNANVQLSGIYQYNSTAKLGQMNFRFSWQYKPLSYFYIVYNGISSKDINVAHQDYQQNAITKISYVWLL